MLCVAGLLMRILRALSFSFAARRSDSAFQSVVWLRESLTVPTSRRFVLLARLLIQTTVSLCDLNRGAKLRTSASWGGKSAEQSVIIPNVGFRHMMSCNGVANSLNVGMVVQASVSGLASAAGGY